MNPFDLRGRVALVSGGNGGIGASAWRELLLRGRRSGGPAGRAELTRAARVERGVSRIARL